MAASPVRDDDGRMPDPATVWAVDLVRDPRKDRQGTLSLRTEDLVFEPRSASAELRIPLEAVKRVRRLRGSPVLLVVHDRTGVRLETAFYFVQPPPLEPVAGQIERPTPLSFGKHSKRRVRRQNVGYLGMSNREKRREIDAWEKAVRAAIEERRAGR